MFDMTDPALVSLRDALKKISALEYRHRGLDKTSKSDFKINRASNDPYVLSFKPNQDVIEAVKKQCAEEMAEIVTQINILISELQSIATPSIGSCYR